MTSRMLLGLCVCLCLASASRAGLLRVPKVYNAIISSSDNLTPSRAFPLIQPVLHESPLGYPLGPVVYHQPPVLQQPETGGYPNNVDDKEPRQETTPKATESPKSNTSSPNKEEKPRENAPRDPSATTENPLKLNDLGLPPSLVPVQPYSPKVTYQYDPYNPYNPYYPDPYGGVIFPYGNPYSPYYQPAFSPNPFNPYVVQSPFYNIPQGEQQGPQWSPEQPWGPEIQQQPEQRPEQAQEPRQGPPALEPQPPKQEQPSDLNIKNNTNKNAAIPDVPPPPLPVGGQRSDKKSS